jgi:hypothetical protein
MKQMTNAISMVPRAQKTFAQRAWSAAKFPLMVAGLAIAITATAVFCNPAYSQKKGKVPTPIESDTLIASKKKDFITQHASKTGENLQFVSTQKIAGSAAMSDTTFVRFEGKLVLNKYDIMKLEGTGCIKLRTFRLYLDKPTSTIYLFDTPMQL